MFSRKHEIEYDYTLSDDFHHLIWKTLKKHETVKRRWVVAHGSI